MDCQTAIIQADDTRDTKVPLRNPKNLPVFSISQQIAIPSPSSGQALVKVLAVAVNPYDYKSAQSFPSSGSCVGCDFHGVVVQLGPPANQEQIKVYDPKQMEEQQVASGNICAIRPGDRVCGSIVGNRTQPPREGAFAEYICARTRLLIKVPSTWSAEEAAALGGVGWKTSALAMWMPNALNLEGRPSAPYAKSRIPVIIYGGATATGTMLCQLLKSGYVPITITSPESKQLSLSYGAAAVAFHTLDSCVHDVKNAAEVLTGKGKTIAHVIDCITDEKSAGICMALFGRLGGKYICLDGFQKRWQTRHVVQVQAVASPESDGVLWDWLRGPLGPDETHTLIPQSVAYEAVVEMQKLVDQGLIRSHPHQLLCGGWETLLSGLEAVGRGEVRRVKLVYSLCTDGALSSLE